MEHYSLKEIAAENGIYYDQGILKLEDELKIPISKFSYGDIVSIDATVKNETGLFGQCYVGVKFYKDGKRFRNKDGLLDEYSGICQFYGRGYREYLYHFVIPDGVDAVEAFISCENGGKLFIKRLEVSTHPFVPNSPQSGIKCVAHLGLTGYAPRNTMAGFYLAKRGGYRECVTNTNFTKDGYLVALHNNTIDETSNGRGLIQEMTLQEARQYDFGGYVSDVYKGSELPLLSDVVKFMAKSGMRPVLRLSSDFCGENRHFLAEIYEMIKDNGLLNRCTAKAFSKEALEGMAEIAGDTIRYGYCCKDVTREEIAWLKTLGTDVYFDLLYTKITREKVELALEHGVNVEAWIINDFESIIRLSEMGVTGFTTDYYMLDNCIF